MTADRPVIGVTAEITVAQGGRFPGYRSVSIYEDYVKGVERGGGLPFVLPVTTDEDVTRAQAQAIDGLLLTGGADIDPLLYGEEPEEKLGAIEPERDVHELVLVKEAIRLGKPIFAICRGIQILNIALGGTLYQDLSYKPHSTLKHEQQSDPTALSHTVHVQEDTYLFGVFGEKTQTNSFHHQAVKDIAEDLSVAATSLDGVVEGLENHERSIIAVQWHPERLARDHEQMQQLFTDFVDRVRKQV